MKKIPFFLMLILSINGDLYAQKSSAENPFEMPQSSIIRTYFIDLGKGDKMKLELYELDDLDAIGNLDSLLRIFIQDMEPLKDSLADELSVKRIDYVADPSGKNKIRIQNFSPTGSSYLVNQGALAALKLEQDTLNILMQAAGSPNHSSKKSSPGSHAFRISFFVNNLANLAAYMDGRLEQHIRDLKKNANNKWKKGDDGLMHSKAAPSISTNNWRGQSIGADYLTIRVTSDIQNYKNYFVPSLTLKAIIVTKRDLMERAYSISAESHFTFEKDDHGKLQTYRNTFLTLGYEQDNKGRVKSAFGFSPSVSLGYLVRQRGNVYEKNTFRFGFGKGSFFNDRLKIEPVIYFNNFFKAVTPGIRISF